MAEGRAPRATDTGLVPAVAHELRSPVAAVREAAAQLRQRGDALDATTRDRLLAVIEHAGDHLLRLADDLAILGSLESGRLPVDVRPCDVREPVERAVAAARVTLGRSVDVRFDVPAVLPDVAADPQRLRQVVTNLLDNAAKHAPASSLITVRVERDGDVVRLSVQDQGPGIRAADLERIFEPTVQLGGSTGSGLGLWIVRELTEAMGARVTVESEPDVGTTFVVTLRLA
jgi:two-component system sensor histidine kinase KdpD